MDNFTYKFGTITNEYDEYVIRCFKNGMRYPEGDYFTDDKKDAEDTFKFLNERNHPVDLG